MSVQQLDSGDISSGFRPIGEEETRDQNRWFSLHRQGMDFVDPKTGRVKLAAADGGQMNYIRYKPGVSVVADVDDGTKTLLMPQERYAVNLVHGKPVLHYEVPGGGIDEDVTVGEVIDPDILIATATRELAEEVGMGASELIVLSMGYGALSHALISTHSNYTVLARGLEKLPTGSMNEATETLGFHEEFTWPETHAMYLNPSGLWVAKEGLKVISSEGTIASLGIAERWLYYERETKPVVIDLKSTEA